MNDSEREQEPLLRKSSTNNSVRFSETDEVLEPDTENGKAFSAARRILRSSSSLSSVIKRFTRSEREHALKKEGVGGAAFLIQDVVLGEQNASVGSYDPYKAPEREWRNLTSIICRRLCAHPSVQRFENATAWMLVALTFIEPPVWCQKWDPTEEGSCRNLLNLNGVGAGMEDTADPVQLYPNTRSMFLSTPQSIIVESVCLGLLGIFLLLRFGRDGMEFSCYFRAGTARVLRIIQTSSYFLLLIGMITHRLYQPYVRGILLATYLPTVQRDVKVLIQMLPEVSNVLIILFVFITFYAWFGCVMFVDTEEGDQHFPNLIEAWWTLWICITTANYPDVMMPSYNQNRWTAVYFVSFMVLSFFFLMNVILASVVGEYESAVATRNTERVNHANENLKEAFSLMDPKDTGRIDRETVMALFLLLNEDFPEVRRISDDDTKLLFAVLDKDGSSTISEEEFMDFGNVLLLEFIRTDVYKSVVEIYFPSIYSSHWYKRFETMIKSDAFEHGIDLILCFNAVVIGIQSYPELSSAKVHLDPKLYDGSIDTVWEFVETIFTFIYAVEAIVKITVLSWRRYSESQKNIFDFTITVLAVVSSIIVYYPNEFSDSRIIRMIVMARVLRLVRLFTAVKRFQLIGTISAEILPDAVPVIMILFLIMYFFAAIGVHNYGGYITRDPSNRLSELVLDTDFSENDYWANNFNDMVSAMNVLFNLLVVNNWTECEVGFEATTEAKWVRLFFIGFHVVGVILVNNLVIAFIINSFMTQLQIIREKDGVEIIDGEAILHHQQARFDGSMITGTKTDLKGMYIAKLRHTSKSEESHRQERLKRLFTQGSSSDNDKGKV